MDEDAELRERMAELFNGRHFDVIMNALLSAVVTMIRDMVAPEQRMGCVTQFAHALSSYVTALADPDELPEEETPEGQTLQ